MSSRSDLSHIEATPGDAIIDIVKEGDRNYWKQIADFLLALCTFFLRTKSDPVVAPKKKLRKGDRGEYLFRYLRIYGDELFQYISLLLVFISWIAANFGTYALWTTSRVASIFMTAMLAILIAEQWKALPHRWLSRRVEKKQTIYMSTVTWVMSMSTSLPGSIFELSSKKVLILPLLAIFTHGPDLLSGMLTNVSKSSANSIMKKVDFTIGPVGGGILGDQGRTFFQSGLKFLSRDSPAEDELAMDFTRGLSTAYVPHMPQEMYSTSRRVVLSYVHAKSLPVYRIREIGQKAKHSINPASLRSCSNSDKDTSPRLEMSAYTNDQCINMGFSYSPGGSGTTQAFEREIEVCRGTADVRFERTEIGTEIRSVGNWILNGSIGEIARIQDGEHNSCGGFSNILSYGVEDSAPGNQAIRLAVAWLIRSATRESDTGYRAEAKFEKGQAHGTISELRYKLPNIWDWIIIGIAVITLLTQGFFVLGHPSALPRAFDTAAIYCGRVLSEHTTRCATRDWKYRRGQKDASEDFTVQFGMVAGPERNPHRPLAAPTRIEGSNEVVGAVHLEYGLPDEIIPVGFMAARDPNRFNPEYVGAALKKNALHYSVKTNELSTIKDMDSAMTSNSKEHGNHTDINPAERNQSALTKESN